MTKSPILCDLITKVYLPFLGTIYPPGKHVFQYIASFHYSPPECQSLSSGGCLTPSQLFYGSILLLVYQRQPAQAPCGCPRKLMTCDQNPPTRKVTSGAGNTAPQLKRLLDLNVIYQTVRNALRKASLKCTGKQRKALSFRGPLAVPLRSTRPGLWRTGAGWIGQIRSRLLGWGQIGGSSYGKSLDWA
jgi:hypothetical protein